MDRTLTKPQRLRRLRSSRHDIPRSVHAEPQTGGGGASGRGPIDDDGNGRKPERPNDGARTQFLIALGILTAGALVMSARMLTKSTNARRLM